MTAALPRRAQELAAVARVQREARAAVLDLLLSPSRHELAWFVMRGARNPKFRRNQPNCGGSVGPGWWKQATIYGHGGFCAND